MIIALKTQIDADRESRDEWRKGIDEKLEALLEFQSHLKTPYRVGVWAVALIAGTVILGITTALIELFKRHWHFALIGILLLGGCVTVGTRNVQVAEAYLKGHRKAMEAWESSNRMQRESYEHQRRLNKLAEESKKEPCFNFGGIETLEIKPWMWKECCDEFMEIK